MKFPRCFALVFAAGILCGCATPLTGPAAKIEQRRELDITIPQGSVRFTVPAGWRIIQQPWQSNAVYVLAKKRDSKTELSVSCDAEPVTRDSDDHALHLKRLRGTRADTFPEAGFGRAGTTHSADGREIWIFHYVGDDDQQLIGIVPEQGFKTTFVLHGAGAKELAAERPALEKLIRSYRCP